MRVYVFGGGTVFHVRPHLALAAPAYGGTARYLSAMTRALYRNVEVVEVLTRMADSHSRIETNRDVEAKVEEVIADPDARVLFFSTAMCDFEGSVLHTNGLQSHSGKDQKRLESRAGNQLLQLTPSAKVISRIRETRKDIFLVGFKTTSGFSEDQQFEAGLTLCKQSHCNLVLANDVHTRTGMIVTPEQSRYCVTKDRELLLEELISMTMERAKGTFARCDVRPGELVPLASPEIPESLRTVLKFAVAEGAYKPFNGKCVGHFAYRKPDNSVLCSIRRSNYNEEIKFVHMTTVNERETIAYGARPSAGSRSQWIMFNKNPQWNCVIHFHCPLRPGARVNVRPQKYFECGSNECGRNTAEGLEVISEDGKIAAVMLDKHGPNILFDATVNPQKVIEFIDAHFDLKKTTQENVSDL